MCYSPNSAIVLCNTHGVGGWVAVQHSQTFGIQFQDSQSGLSHLSQRLSVIAAGERKAMHASSLGHNATITWKIYFFSLIHKYGSRIFRGSCSSLEEEKKNSSCYFIPEKSTERGRNTEVCSFDESAIKEKNECFFLGQNLS